MKLKDLIKGLNLISFSGDDNIDITAIEYDSRKEIQKGSLFVCIDGIDEDGHAYINKVKEAGAVCVVVTKKVKNPFKNIIEVTDGRETLAFLAAKFYEEPTNKLNVTGITGTKGKTTIAKMLKEILDMDNKKCSLSGTLGMFIGDRHIKTKNTTPSALDLQKFFYDSLKEKCEYSVMEVASIALKQKRVNNINFNIGIYTNLARTHIGKREHSDFNDYMESKAKLFTMCNIGIINIDDAHYKDMIKNATCDIITYSYNNKKADVYSENVKTEDVITTFTYVGLDKKFDVSISMPGTFNIVNAIAAITGALLLDVDIQSIKKGLANVKVKGRCEVIPSNTPYKIMIDYAHNQSSLEKLLSEMKLSTKGRVIAVFGCGGDRDNAMRYEMGEISGKLADYTIITSDNPRTEDPNKIISMIEDGMKKTIGKYTCIEDRTKAIKYAINMAKENDLIVLAGKGHETYIEKNNIRTHYDEREVVANILKELT